MHFGWVLGFFWLLFVFGGVFVGVLLMFWFGLSLSEVFVFETWCILFGFLFFLAVGCFGWFLLVLSLCFGLFFLFCRFWFGHPPKSRRDHLIKA